LDFCERAVVVLADSCYFPVSCLFSRQLLDPRQLVGFQTVDWLILAVKMGQNISILSDLTMNGYYLQPHIIALNA
jgi:hypothetical protein